MYTVVSISFVLLLFFVSTRNKSIQFLHTKGENYIPSSQCNKKKKPLQVFIMIGQSNVVGHGYVDLKDNTTGLPLNGTLEWLVKQQEYANVHLQDNTTHTSNSSSSSSEWIQREDVWIAYNKQNGGTSAKMKAHGKLTVGYGGHSEKRKLQIGPELGFGFAIGDAMDAQVLILKIAWGGKSLAVDFRPPSSSGKENEGRFYRAAMNNIQQTLQDPKSLFPSYCDSDEYCDSDDHGSKCHRDCSCNGYEIAGFVWHQGVNDGTRIDMALEYESNLVHLIRDVRRELKVPTLPVSIGVSGQCGWKCSPNKERVIQAQFNVSQKTDAYPDFQDTVMSVDTRAFARKGYPFSPGNQAYHWNNNCESYWLVGKAMGDAMLQLLHK